MGIFRKDKPEDRPDDASASNSATPEEIQAQADKKRRRRRLLGGYYGTGGH